LELQVSPFTAVSRRNVQVADVTERQGK
jgi:hypothetical protein